VFYQPVDPKDVLDMKFDKEDLAFYVRNFLPIFLIMMAMPFGFVLLRLGRPDNDIHDVISGGIKLLIANLVFFIAAMIAMFVITSNGKKRYRACIARYGHDDLASQLGAADNIVFYVHPLKYESYVIITREYLILARTMIIRLDEIRQMRFERVPKGDISRPFDISKKHPSEITRFCRKVHIVNEKGIDTDYLIALPDAEYYPLINYLAGRLGPNIVYIN
jgi:hypothetical protein